MQRNGVLFVNHTSTISGAEMVLLDIIPAFSRPGIFLFEKGALNAASQKNGAQVITARFGEGLARIRRDGNLFKALALSGQLAAILVQLIARARKYRVLYANSQKAFTLAALAAPVARCRLIWHLHDIISEDHFGAAQRRMQVALANRFASKVIVPAQAGASAFIKAGGRKELVEIIPNGLEIPAAIETPQEIRQRLDLPAGPLAGVFSRLAPWKGQHVVLQALQNLPGVQCIIAGSALFGEHAYESELRDFVCKNGLSKRVHFLGNRDDVPDLMRAVDIVIHPSVDPEPFGRTLVEAMRAGTPVIATDTGAAREILDYGKAGILVPPGDSKALARQIAALTGTPEKITAMTGAALKRALDNYGVERMRERAVKAVSGVLGEQPA